MIILLEYVLIHVRIVEILLKVLLTRMCFSSIISNSRRRRRNIYIILILVLSFSLLLILLLRLLMLSYSNPSKKVTALSHPRIVIIVGSCLFLLVCMLCSQHWNRNRTCPSPNINPSISCTEYQTSTYFMACTANQKNK